MIVKINCIKTFFAYYTKSVLLQKGGENPENPELKILFGSKMFH